MSKYVKEICESILMYINESMTLKQIDADCQRGCPQRELVLPPSAIELFQCISMIYASHIEIY